MKWLVLITALLCLAALPAKAGTEAPQGYDRDTDPTYDTPVLACRTSADCAVFTPPCRAPIAVNTDSLPALEDWKQRTAYRFGCRVVKGPIYGNAECVQGYCSMRMRAPRPSAGRNPKACTADADCRVAVDSCDRKYAVNAENHDEEQALLDTKGPCGTVRDTRPVRELRCTFGTCNVILGDYGNQK